MDSRQSYSLTFARLALGTILFVHGLANSFGILGGPGVERMAADVAKHLSTASDTMMYLVAYAQLLLGLLLILGAFARVSALVVLTLTVIHFLGSARYQAFFVRDNGFEFLLAAAALCVIVATLGPGPLCVNIKLGRKRKE